jgi:sodium borate transporter 11
MNATINVNLTEGVFEKPCSRDSSLLYILLTLGTVWLGTFLYKFKQTPYLTSAKRELLADYALPVSVIIMSLIGSLLFSKINRKKVFFLYFKIFLNIKFYLVKSFSVEHKPLFDLVRFKSVTSKQIIATGGLGFSLSLLMFLVCIYAKIFFIKLIFQLYLGSKYRRCYC